MDWFGQSLMRKVSLKNKRLESFIHSKFPSFDSINSPSNLFVTKTKIFMKFLK